MSAGDLEQRFGYHPPQNPETIHAHEATRDDCLHLALVLDERLPDGREKSLAITHLEEVMFWANAAIARNGGPKERVVAGGTGHQVTELRCAGCDEVLPIGRFGFESLSLGEAGAIDLPALRCEECIVRAAVELTREVGPS